MSATNRFAIYVKKIKKFGEMDNLKKSRVKLWSGCVACAEGAIAAGCRFFAGYPITPAVDIAERIFGRFLDDEGVYIQMEDEIASIASVLGASWTGVKAMTATSGPGISLMLENIGLGIMTETPCVIVNVQRGSPSTGLPTSFAQSDMMQARWGAHGDYEIIALVPNSPQECFDLTVRAFNLSEKYRLPVFVLTDAFVGNMIEKVVVPEKIEIFNRVKPDCEPRDYLPYDNSCLVPPMAMFAQGYKVHATGLTHDEHGYPSTESETQNKLVRRLVDKVRKNLDDIVAVEQIGMRGAKTVIISYGVTSRIIPDVLKKAQRQGVKLGHLRLITAWPFPEKEIAQLSEKVDRWIVPELNMGQFAAEVQKASAGRAEVVSIDHAGGDIFHPETIYERIEDILI